MELLAAPSEPLGEHLKNVADEVAKLFLKKRAQAMVRIAKPFSLSVRDAERALIYAAALHDVGKAYDWFQARIHGAAAKNGRFTVPRHEVFSAVAASQVLDGVFSSPLPYDCTLLSIVWHMLASRGPVLSRIAGTMKRYVDVENVHLGEQEKSELANVLNSILSEYGSDFKINLSKLPTEISCNDAKKLLRDLEDCLILRSSKYFVRGNNILYYVTLPAFSAVQAADLLVAKRSRGGRGLLIEVTDVSIADKCRRAIWPGEQ